MNIEKDTDFPLVSIVIPVYNREAFLAECIESILNLPLGSYEILIIDDGSTDDSRNLIKKYQEENEQIHAYFLPKNMGPGNARNVGLVHAKGEFISFVDSDDLINYEKFFNMLQVLKSQDKVDAFLFNHELFYSNNTTRKVYTVKQEKLYNKQEFFEEFPYILTAPICTYIFRTAFLQSYKIRFPDLYYIEDASFATKVLLKAERFYTYPEHLYNYRYVSDNSLVLFGDKKKKREGIDFYLHQLLNYSEEGVAKRAIESAMFSMCVRSVTELDENDFKSSKWTRSIFRVTKNLFDNKGDIKTQFFEIFLTNLKRISNSYSKPILICPASKYSLELAKIIGKNGGNVIAFYDNNLDSPYLKIAESEGYRIDLLENLQFVNKEAYCVVVFHTSFACYDIIKQIESYGFEYDKNFVCGLNT